MSPVINPTPLEAPEGPSGPGPCDWPVNLSCCPEFADYDLAVRTTATSWATEILDALTGRQFARCPVNYRPCGPRCANSFGYLTWPVNSQSSASGIPWMIPYIDSGIWRNCGCTGGCSCRARCEVPFPGSVASVQQVLIDGVELDPSAYRLDSYRGSPVLVRTDGECWPQCQDMELGPNDVGAFTIVYVPGSAVPMAGQIAAGLLACEFAKNCTGQACSLPQQLASLSRNGVEVQVIDPNTVLEEGFTGVAMVDLWIKSVNPYGKRQPSRVYSPDIPGPRFS